MTRSLREVLTDRLNELEIEVSDDELEEILLVSNTSKMILSAILGEAIEELDDEEDEIGIEEIEEQDDSHSDRYLDYVDPEEW